MIKSQLQAEERACPVCESRQYKPFADEDIDENHLNDFSYASRKQPEFMCLRLVICSQCSLVYAPNTPQNHFLQEAYEAADYDSSEEARYAAKTYAKALQPYIKKLPSYAGALDIGAGNGLLLPWLQQWGFQKALGIEPSAKAIAAAPAEVKPLLQQGMFDAKSVEGLDLSLICSFMTLEHVAEPISLVTAAYAALQDKGMIALVVHNRQGLLNRLLGLKSPIIDIEHLQLFNKKSTAALLLTAGFQHIRIHSIVNTYPLRYWLRLMPLPNSFKKIVGFILEKTGLSRLPLALPVGNLLAIGYK
jgi:SAM-dependent methyltransferase